MLVLLLPCLYTYKMQHLTFIVGFTTGAAAVVSEANEETKSTAASAQLNDVRLQHICCLLLLCYWALSRMMMG